MVRALCPDFVLQRYGRRSLYERVGLHRAREMEGVRAVQLVKHVPPPRRPRGTRRDLFMSRRIYATQMAIAKRLVCGSPDVPFSEKSAEIMHSSEYSIVFRTRAGVVKTRNARMDMNNAYDDVLYAEQNLANEIVVAHFCTNVLALPNFVKLLGHTRSHPTYVPSAAPRTAQALFNVRAPMSAQYAIFEDLEGAKTLSDWFDENVARESFGKDIDAIIAQVLLALAEARDACEFSHNDLHMGNIMVVPVEPCTLAYNFMGKRVYVVTRNIAKIIDLGLSSARIDTRQASQTKRVAWATAARIPGGPDILSPHVFRAGAFRPDILLSPDRTQHVYDTVRFLSSLIDALLFDEPGAGEEQRASDVGEVYLPRRNLEPFHAIARWFRPLLGASTDALKWVSSPRIANYWKRWIMTDVSAVPVDIEIDSRELVRMFMRSDKRMQSALFARHSKRAMPPLYKCD